jgi:hypothetical protein
MKDCYLVMVSSGEWEDNVKFNTGTVFLSLLSAEKELEKINTYYTTEEPFPFDYCTEEEFKKFLYEGKVLEEEEFIYDEWEGEKYEKEEFNHCWIEKLKLEE